MATYFISNKINKVLIIIEKLDEEMAAPPSISPYKSAETYLRTSLV